MLCYVTYVTFYTPALGTAEISTPQSTLLPLPLGLFSVLQGTLKGPRQHY